MVKVGTLRRAFCLAMVLLLASALLVLALPAQAGACGFTTWYLPEGYTGDDFDTYILVQNPNDWEAEAKVRFMTEEGVGEPLELELPANSRSTVMVDEQPGLADASVSTMVEATSGVVVERAMYFNYEGERAGGSDSIGATEKSQTWYLAEGYTGGEFDTYVLVMNPNEVPVRIRAQFATPADAAAGGGEREANPHDPEPEPEPAPDVDEPEYIEREYEVGAMRRFTIHVDEIPGLEDTEVSTKVEVVSGGCGGEAGRGASECASGIVVERAMYFNYMGVNGGHCSIGTPRPSSTWYLPEGRTAGEYDTYVLVLNPNATRTKVKATFMVPPSGTGRVANPHDEEPEPKPEPEPADDEEPEIEPVPGELIVKEYTLEPFERYTIALDQVEGLEATDVATMIESSALEGCGAGGCESNPVVVERAMYFSRGNDGDGHNSMGATDKHEYWLLAEGYTGGAFDTWVLVQNPNAFDVRVRATFMTPEGAPVEREYVIGRWSRLTVPVDEIAGLGDAEVSTKLQVLGPEDEGDEGEEVGEGRHASCSYGIVAERAMYFEYNGVTGGHCSLGFGE